MARIRPAEVDHPSCIGASPTRSLHLFWGAKALVDLYEHDLVQQWTKAHPSLRYTPVLSNLDADDSWQGRRGLVHESVFDAYPDMSGVEIYTSGPPALVGGGQEWRAATGTTPERLHFDSFEYAPDALAKMRRRGA